MLTILCWSVYVLKQKQAFSHMSVLHNLLDSLFVVLHVPNKVPVYRGTSPRVDVGISIPSLFRGNADTESSWGNADTESFCGDADAESPWGNADTESSWGTVDTESFCCNAVAESPWGNVDAESSFGRVSPWRQRDAATEVSRRWRQTWQGPPLSSPAHCSTDSSPASPVSSKTGATEENTKRGSIKNIIFSIAELTVILCAVL